MASNVFCGDKSGIHATATGHVSRAFALLFSTLAALVAALAFSGPAVASVDSGAQAPAISSDKADYAPGELVTLRGSDWRAGETVTIDVNDDAGQTWRRTVDVTADSDGRIVDSFNLPDWFVALYTVTATGSESGTAVTSFTDGNFRIKSNSSTIFFSLTWVEHRNNTTCTAPPADQTSGSESSVGNQNSNDFSGGVAASNSLFVTAAHIANTGEVFSHWTGLDIIVQPDPHSICIPGNFTGQRNYFANYVPNTPPVANGDAYSVDEDGALIVGAPGVLGNDTDANGQALTVGTPRPASGPANGALALNADGSFTYTPNANFFGSDSFTYRANDGFANSNLATVSLTVNAVNDAPSFTKGADQTAAEDSGAQTVAGWATGISTGPANESGQTLTFDVANDNNSLFSTQPAVAANGTLTYTPAPNAHGSAIVTLSLSDSGGTANGGVDTSAAQTFTITVTPVNDAPTCAAGSATTAEDTPVGLSLSCADVDGDPLSYAIVSGPANGGLSGSGASRTYSPDLNYHGSDSFTFRASDGSLDSNVATFELTITPVNDAPVANPDTVAAVEDTALVLQADDLTGNDADVDGDDLTVTAVGDASGGSVALADGEITFTPTANLCGAAAGSFEYSVSDGNGGSASATVSVDVDCVNDAPVVTADDASVAVDEGETAESSGTWFDVEGDDVTLSATVGTVTKHDDGTWSWSYETTDGPADSDTVTITADDGPDTGSASFELTVGNVAPSAAFAAPVSVNEGSDIVLTLTDPSDPSSVDTAAGFEYAFDCGSGYGAFGSSNETTCPTSDNGSRSVRGTVRDKDGGETEYSDSVSIENVAPVVSAGGDQAADEGTLTSFDLGSFVDPGADSPWSVAVDWGDGSVDSTFNFNSMTPFVASANPYSLALEQHEYDDNGVYTVTVTVTDKDGAPGSDTFEVTVANVAPSAVLSNDGPLGEGSPATVSFSDQADVSSADTAAGFRYAYDCDGGAFGTAPTYAGSSTAVSHECTFADDGVYTVSAAIVDKDDGYSVYETQVVVENVDPMVTAPAGQSANEGEPTSFDLGSFTDPGADFPWDVDVDWGDGGTDSFLVTSAGFLPSTLHTYDDNGTYTVTVAVTDKDGGSGSATFEVAVANIAPEADFENDGPVAEGSAFRLELNNASDPSSADTNAGFEYAFDCGDGSGYGSFGSGNTASCPTSDDGTRSVKGKVRDKDGDATEYTATVTIENVAPTATLSNNGPVGEGSPATVTFSDQADVSSADAAAGFRYAYDCDGGTFATAPTYAGSSTAASHECTFADDGVYTVSAAIVDKDDGYSVYETQVVVENVAPTAAIEGAPESSPEGTAIDLTGTFTDPGVQDTHTFAWGVTKNGSPYGPGGTGEDFSFTPDDNGSYVVTLTVTDDDGGSGSDSVTIAVTNVAPAAAIDGAPATSPEGTEVQLTSTVTDPGTADTHSYAWSVTKNGSAYGSGGTSAGFSFTPDDDGSYVVMLTVTDDDGGSGSVSKTITVTNVAPSATFGNDGPVDEGSSFTLSLTSPSDPSSADAAAGFEYAFDCGSGYGSFGGSSTATCSTSDNGARDVRAKIRDKDGAETEYTATVAIDNVAPSATFGNNGPVTEGSSFNLSLTSPSDPSPADTAAGFTYAFDCGDGSGYGAYGPSNTASCPTSDNGTRDVKGKIRDKDLGEREYTGTVTITNVGPTVTITSPPYGTLYPMGTLVTVTAGFSDLGTDDTHTCAISWDNGLGTTTGTVNQSADTCTGSRQLTAAGVYTIRVTVTDDDGASGFDETLVVIYDPNVGHVTGGGWINSPAGAYVPDPTLAGRANFGFNARYLKGAKAPSGSTEFQFQTGNLNFHSTVYEWLVVSGAKGQFKGTGTINGAGGYGFLLTVTDGQLSGGNGTDKFRIKIWGIASGATVYDNQPGSDDIDASDTQEIVGGSIVIHKSK